VFIVIWQYQVKPGCEEAFENMYGPNGDWVQLFQPSPEYSQTILLKESPGKRFYQTLDFWNSHDAYEHFYTKYESEISRLDQIGDELTVSEMLIGRFMTVN